MYRESGFVEPARVEQHHALADRASDESGDEWPEGHPNGVEPLLPENRSSPARSAMYAGCRRRELPAGMLLYQLSYRLTAGGSRTPDLLISSENRTTPARDGPTVDAM